MSISIEDVEYVATLARLALDDEAKRRFARQLADILNYIDKLSELDTLGVPPLVNASANRNVFRVDEPHPSLRGEEAIANAPARAHGCFKVPRVIEA